MCSGLEGFSWVTDAGWNRGPWFLTRGWEEEPGVGVA